MSQNPITPAPGSTTQQVQKFFTDFFLANDYSLSQSQAEGLAAQLQVNGDSLHMLSKETLVQVFGIYGDVIFTIIQSSHYNYVS